MTPYAVQMTATDLMNGSVHRNVRQRLLLFYHIYGRKPEKNYNTYKKNYTIEIQKNYLNIKLKNCIGILTRNRKYQLHEDRPYDIVKGYRRTFRSLFLQFTGSSPQFQEKLQKRIENRRVMRFEGIEAGIFLLSAV